MSCPDRDFSERNCTKWGCEERVAGCAGEMRGVTSPDNLVLLDGARRPVSASKLSSPVAGPPLFAPRRADERSAAGAGDRLASVVRIHPGYEPGRPLAA
jgi:hypothetical protein